MKLNAACLLALLAGLCSGFQKPGGQVPSDQTQAKHIFEKPLTWSYPEGPTAPVEPVPDFEIRQPVQAATVSVECRESQARVEAQMDFFGIGQFIKPSDLTLGPCGAVGEDTQAHVLIFETELQDCGSMLQMTDDTLIYTFTLNYSPTRLGGSPVVRTNEAAVIVECHYPRHHNVSSLPLDPQWIPFSAVRVAEEFLYFTLSLRTDDWMFERPRIQYYLGDMIRIEASVMQYHHVPLRVFVENCVATLSPDINSSPRYTFLDNGCLIDATITGADSRFMQRTVENTLQFQFEAFRFQGADSGQLYITCQLRATSTGHDIDVDHRACSYINGWREASGVDSACSTCDAGGGQQTNIWHGGDGSTGGGNTGGGNTGGGNTGGGNTGGGQWSTGGKKWTTGSSTTGSSTTGSGVSWTTTGGSGSGTQTSGSKKIWTQQSGGTGSGGTGSGTTGSGTTGGGVSWTTTGGSGSGTQTSGPKKIWTQQSGGTGSGGTGSGVSWTTTGTGGSGTQSSGSKKIWSQQSGTTGSSGTGSGTTGGGVSWTTTGGSGSGTHTSGSKKIWSQQSSTPGTGTGTGTGTSGVTWTHGGGSTTSSTWTTGSGGGGGVISKPGGQKPGGQKPGGSNPGVQTGKQTVTWNPTGGSTSSSTSTSTTTWTTTSTGGTTWSGRKGRSIKEAQDYEWRGIVTLGPFDIAEKLA
ncbi:hornerin-like [Corythoichthys intestinalis]|uniref:hornerin-like n=1 Tax=Corythoichthys intestinalis TaxID=161448 RepID=UPI0025A5C188|nr:hornerin-like [Corythoichthys intestinalis]